MTKQDVKQMDVEKQDVTPVEVTVPEKTGLALLRAPFPANQISKLPKPTRAQTDEVKADFKKGIRCAVCGGWHHPKVVHLDYVGHAALTDRLLDCDENWDWEPVATNEDGTPKIDGNGGMWIRLTVCDKTRLGYGHADGKKGGDAIKEVIGDALRNAAMRFGAALDLWHKGDLHAEPDDEVVSDPPISETQTVTADQLTKLRNRAAEAGVSEAAICKFYEAHSFEPFPAELFEGAMKKLNATLDAKAPPKDDLNGDGIPEFEGSASE